MNQTWVRALLVVVAGLALSGCASGPGAAAIVAALFLAAVACSGDEAKTEDLEGQQEGHWETCCENGVVSACWCDLPGPSSCNYGAWMVQCGGETGALYECPDAGVPDTGVADAGFADGSPPDAGGTWERCCVDGQITTCLCPTGAICNYGWFEDCGDGICANPGDTCPQ